MLVVFVGLFVAQDCLTFPVDLPSPVAPTKLVALLRIVLVVFVGLFVAQDCLMIPADLPTPVVPIKLVALLQLGLVDPTDHNQPMFVQDPFVLMLFPLIYWLSHRPVAVRLVAVCQIRPWLFVVLVGNLGSLVRLKLLLSLYREPQCVLQHLT